MTESPASMEELLERFVAWAEANPDIRGAFLVGSRARIDRPADEWSDLDIAVIATDSERYLSRADWVEEIGCPRITFIEGTPAGGRERRVLFNGGLDVDFSIMSPEDLRRVTGEVAMVLDVVRRGLQVLVDKEGFAAAIPDVSGEKPAGRPPQEAEFLEVVNDFWYHAVWTAKKLRRGELFIAKSCCDSYMKRLLRQMIEWHARAMHGWDYDVWHDGRFLDQWADPRAVAGLREAYARYDENDVRRALFATMDLFRWLAMETAGRLGFCYPADGDRYATEWVRGCLDP
jgi:aminoglycoside 6-adenylyltransferase